MGLITWRDLQFRRRRFAIATLATALVFAIALLLTGVAASFDAEIDRTTAAFGADAWIVPVGAAGPFTNIRAFDPAPIVGSVEGADEVGALTMVRVTVLDPTAKDLLVFGTSQGFGPPATDGRDAEQPGEVVIDESFGVDIGEQLDLGAQSLTVVGTYGGLTLFAGTPTATVSIEDTQDLAFGGQPLATALAVRGQPSSIPDGFLVTSAADAADDVARPLAQATSTIDFLRILLWLIAVGIVGSIVYLTVLERTRDFAVLKATGVSGRSIFASVVLQAVVVSLAAALVAIVLSLLLRPFMSLSIDLAPSTFAFLPVVATLAGAAASLVGVRRAVGVDPALAFG